MSERTWCVYHLIHVQTPHQHIPKLVITEVPESETVDTDLLERAGFQFGEFGIPWANHMLEEVDVKESPADLVARIRQGEGEYETFASIERLAEAPL
jgi:hypothetical protein